MELHMHTPHMTHQWPDWRAAVMSGLGAGVVFLVLETVLATAIMGASPWTLPRMMAAIILGPEVLTPPVTFEPGIFSAAMGVHFVLAIILGGILAAIITAFKLDASHGMVLATGVVFGFLVYLINFYGMTAFFSWFVEARGAITLFSHLVFGATAAEMYKKLERTKV